MLISIIIRAYNEQRHLESVLRSIAGQDCTEQVEVLLVDSGSTDDTVAIAERHGCRIIRIAKEQFTFGRSLNLGCRHSKGDILVFISAHCIPAASGWLRRLVQPVIDGRVAYAYGRQVGGEESRFSECQIFRKYYPGRDAIPQSGFFCNNANAAIARKDWELFPFDEQLTGLEDMALARKICDAGRSVGYVADAAVYHLHDETWRGVKNRFEREAVALQAIMPQVHIGFGDFLRYWFSAVFMDLGAAMHEHKAMRNAWPIVAYRCVQFWGSYRGNHEHRKLSQAMKDRYFYPK